MGWQWHQLDHMQIICTSLQTDNHASTSPLYPPAVHTCVVNSRRQLIADIYNVFSKTVAMNTGAAVLFIPSLYFAWSFPIMSNVGIF